MLNDELLGSCARDVELKTLSNWKAGYQDQYLMALHVPALGYFFVGKFK